MPPQTKKPVKRKGAPKGNTGTGGGLKKPGIPPLPNVDYDFVGNLPAELAAARAAAEKAAGGQLATIANKAAKQIGGQASKFDKRTDRILRNINRTERQSRQFYRDMRRGISVQQRHNMAAGGAQSIGITGNRAAVTKAAAKGTAQALGGQSRQASMTRQAGVQAIQSAYSTEAASNKASMSILEVLGAERKADDIKYIQGLQHEEKMAEIQHAQQLQIAQMGFEQDVYKMKLQQKMEKDFINWQREQGILLTPEEEAAVQWKYDKKRIQLPYRLEKNKAEREGEADAFHNFDVQMTAMEDAIQSTAEVMNKPGLKAKAEAAYGNLPTRDAVVQYVRDSVAQTVPEGTELSAINSVIAETADSIAAGGMAPRFETIKQHIAQTSPEMRAYLESNPQLEQVHDSYAAIRTSMRTGADKAALDEYAKTQDEGILDRMLGGVDEAIGSVLGSNAATGAMTATATIGLPAMLYKTALSAGSADIANTTHLAKLRGGATQMADDAVAAVRGFLAKPGAFQNAVSGALRRVGAANPFKMGPKGLATGIGSESGAAGATLLSNLGLLATAGVVSHKLIDSAADAFVFAEGAEDESLESTFNLMDAKAEAILAKGGEIADLKKIVDAELDQPRGNAGGLWSKATGWDDNQKDMIWNRYEVLRRYIDAKREEQNRATIEAYNQ